MRLFGERKLGRIGYISMIVLMVLFDFAKGPIERLSIMPHDFAAKQLMDRQSGSPDADAIIVDGKPGMPLMMPAQRAALDPSVRDGRKPTEAELKQVRAEVERSALLGQLNGNADAETVSLVQQRSMLALLPIATAIALTGLTVVGLLWAVSSRLRDIGWPPYLLAVVLAPYFLPRIFNGPLTPTLDIALTSVFFAGLLFLALPPFPRSKEGHPAAPPAPAPRPSGGRQQFGKRGTA